MKVSVNFVTNLDSSHTVAIHIVSSLTTEILDSSRAPGTMFDCCTLLATASIWSDKTSVDHSNSFEFNPNMLNSAPIEMLDCWPAEKLPFIALAAAFIS